MEILKLNCRIISPMFIGDALGRNVELNAVAIKASLMFWWRAIHSNLDVLELKKQEAIFFGGSYIVTKDDDKTETINKKPFFRFISVDISKLVEDRIPLDPRSHKKFNETVCYLEGDFSIALQILNNEERERVLALFNLASALGSLGKRSRRGAGAWLIDGVTYNKENINKWITLINPSFDITKAYKEKETFPFLKNFKIGNKIYSDNKKLRERIMSTAHDCKDKYKRKKMKDGNEVRNKRGEIQYNYFAFDNYLGKAFGGRLASPVYVSMLKVENGVKPMISILNTKDENNGRNKVKGEELQKLFIEAIINNIKIKDIKND